MKCFQRVILYSKKSISFVKLKFSELWFKIDGAVVAKRLPLFADVDPFKRDARFIFWANEFANSAPASEDASGVTVAEWMVPFVDHKDGVGVLNTGLRTTALWSARFQQNIGPTYVNTTIQLQRTITPCTKYEDVSKYLIFNFLLDG